MGPRASAGSASAVICRDGSPIAGDLRGAAIAIGNFDGVHRGHQHLVRTAKAEAAARRRPAGVLTFEPHPRTFFAPETAPFRLTPEREKLKILGALGLDVIFLRRFDATLAGTSASDFVTRLMARELDPSVVVVGRDFHFGRGREGNPAILEDLSRQCGLVCIVSAAVEEHGSIVSSSRIRTAIGEGDFGLANDLLGYRWFVSGEVMHGDKRGRTLGFPTANLRLAEVVQPAHGIYAVRVSVAGGAVREGVASFGRRPTFDDGPPLLETYIFDFADDLYGRQIEVEFVGWIRGEERFASADALVARMHEDSRAARTMIREARPDALSFIG